MSVQISSEAYESLSQRGLLPPEDPGTGLLPSEPVLRVELYRAKARGSLIGGAIGDALGRPAEGRPPAQVERVYGRLTDFIPWRGWQGGPRGTVTDDTQLTMCVARCLVECGCLDPEDLARRFVDWLPEGRGKGQACTAAVHNLIDGKPWHAAGVDSAGNGAAMRAAPIGITHSLRVDTLRLDAALSAVVTHADPMATASAIAQAYAVAYLLHVRPGELDTDAFLDSLCGAIADLRDPGHPERRPDSDGFPVRLVDRIGELGGLLGQPSAKVFDYLYNGAFVLESLPAAIWCFLEYREDPEAALTTAVNAGYDADTVASMAGNLAGAHLGEEAFPDRWREDLEYAAELRQLADRLIGLSTSS